MGNLQTADLGLQPERTVLAWRRTAYAQWIVVSMLLRGIYQDWRGLAIGAIVFGLLSSIIVFCASGKYRTFSSGIKRGTLAPSTASVVLLSAYMFVSCSVVLLTWLSA